MYKANTHTPEFKSININLVLTFCYMSNREVTFLKNYFIHTDTHWNKTHEAYILLLGNGVEGTGELEAVLYIFMSSDFFT